LAPTLRKRKTARRNGELRAMIVAAIITAQSNQSRGHVSPTPEALFCGRLCVPAKPPEQLGPSMSYSKSIAILLTTAVCATAFAADAGAQSRGRSSGGRGPTVGRAAPRSEGPRTQAPRGNSGQYDSRGVSPRGIGRAPLRSYSYPYSYYGYRPGLTIGLGLYGYPSYGYYGYPYYGYPYGAYGYGYSYGGYYPDGYGYGGYGGYVVPRAGYAGGAYGGIRIQGAPRDAQVFVDGYYAGIVDDYDGTFQRLDLDAGPHEIEIRTAGRPLAYDVNVTPGQTLTIHANVR
jgi:hypothetical protein